MKPITNQVFILLFRKVIFREEYCYCIFCDIEMMQSSVLDLYIHDGSNMR